MNKEPPMRMPLLALLSVLALMGVAPARAEPPMTSAERDAFRAEVTRSGRSGSLCGWSRCPATGPNARRPGTGGSTPGRTDATLP